MVLIPELKERINYLKNDQEARETMCRSIEALQQQAANKAALEATINTRKEKQETQIKKMLSCGMSPAEILRVTTYTEDTVYAVESSMKQPS